MHRNLPSLPRRHTARPLHCLPGKISCWPVMGACPPPQPSPRTSRPGVDRARHFYQRPSLARNARASLDITDILIPVSRRTGWPSRCRSARLRISPSTSPLRQTPSIAPSPYGQVHKGEGGDDRRIQAGAFGGNAVEDALGLAGDERAASAASDEAPHAGSETANVADRGNFAIGVSGSVDGSHDPSHLDRPLQGVPDARGAHFRERLNDWFCRGETPPVTEADECANQEGTGHSGQLPRPIHLPARQHSRASIRPSLP